MRNHALDTARAVATALVITAHAAIAYMETPIGWAIQGPYRHVAADLYVWIVRSMVMPLFFWLAGYFACALYERAGITGFIQQRAVRILAPLVVAIVPCSLALNALWDWGREVATRQGVPAHVPALAGSGLPLTLGHLWFLYYLLAISVLALAIVPLARALAPALRVPPILAGVLSAVPLAYRGELGLDTPLGFALDVDVVIYEGAFFAWGWLAHRDGTELARAAKRAPYELVAAFALLGALVPMLRAGGEIPGYAILASGLFSLLLVDATLGLCVRYGSRPRPLLRALSDASYAVYIVHLPVIVLLQIAIASWHRPSP